MIKDNKSNSRTIDKLYDVLFSALKILFPMFKKPNNLDLKSIYFLLSSTLAILTIFFYGLSYIFFYAYYFCVNKNNMPMLDIIINPIPFNFRSLSILGFFLVIIFAILLYCLGKIIKSIKANSISIFIFDVIILLAITSVIHLFLVIFFTGDLSNYKSSYDIWLYVVFIIVMISLFNSNNIFSTVYGIIGSFEISVIYIVIIRLLNISEENPSIYIFLFLCFIFSVMFSFYRCDRIKKIMLNSITFIIIFSLIVWFDFPLPGYKWIKLAFLITISIACTVVIINLIKRLINNIKIQINNNVYHFPKQIKVFLLSNLKLYKIIILPMAVLFYIVLLGSWIFQIGVSIQNNLSNNSQDIIKYYTANQEKLYETLEGKIVCYKDNMFYISTKDKKLIIIKTDKVYIEQK